MFELQIWSLVFEQLCFGIQQQSGLFTLAMFPHKLPIGSDWITQRNSDTMKKVPCLGYWLCCFLQACFIWCPKYHLGNFLLGEIYQPPRSGVQRKCREGTITDPLADLKEQNRLCFTFPNPIVRKKVQNSSLLILLNQDSSPAKWSLVKL